MCREEPEVPGPLSSLLGDNAVCRRLSSTGPAQAPTRPPIATPLRLPEGLCPTRPPPQEPALVAKIWFICTNKTSPGMGVRWLSCSRKSLGD
jgi:hypothetical protein